MLTILLIVLLHFTACFNGNSDGDLNDIVYIVNDVVNGDDVNDVCGLVVYYWNAGTVVGQSYREPWCQ